MLGHRTGETSRVSKPRPAGQTVDQLSNRLHRMTAALGLILLTAGILSCSADALLNHSSHYISEVPSEHRGCDSSSVPAHLVKEVATHKLPPCNACFFQHLVAYSLIPRKYQHVPIKLTSRFHLTYRSYSSEFFCPRKRTGALHQSAP